MSSQLNSVSPLDGRYSSSTKELSAFFSEAALIKYRLKIEIEYIIALSKEKTIKEFPRLSKQEQDSLKNIYDNFNLSEAKKIKQLEKKINHDVKAVEYYIQKNALKRTVLDAESNMSSLTPIIHVNVPLDSSNVLI